MATKNARRKPKKVKSKQQEYTQTQALEEIFNNNKEPLPSKLVVYKHRYKKGLLAQKAIDEILEQYGFKVIQETLYVKV